MTNRNRIAARGRASGCVSGFHRNRESTVCTRLLRMHKRSRRSGCWFGQSFYLPIASFFHAGTEVAGLRALFDDKRRAAFRAGFVERFVRRSVVAIGIAAATVKDAAAPAPFGRTAADEFSFSAFRAFDSERDGPRIFALWIIFTTDAIPEAALSPKELARVQRTFFIEPDIRLARGARAAHQTPRSLAIRIAGACKEYAEAAAFDGHFLAAVIAVLNFHFAIVRRELRRKILDEVAIRIAVAAQ